MAEDYGATSIGTSLAKHIKQLDNYSLPIHLTYKMKSYFTTNLGSIISLIVYGLTIALGVYLIIDTANKSNQNIVSFPRNYLDPPMYNLSMTNEDNLKLADNKTKTDNNDNEEDDEAVQEKEFKIKEDFFFFAYSFINKTNRNIIPISMINRIFTFDLRTIRRNASTGIFSDIELYSLIRCGDKFNKFPFENNLLMEAGCLNSTKYQVVGDFISPIYQYVNIKFQACKTTKTKTDCFSKADIDKYVQQIELTFIGTNYVINPRIIGHKSFISYVPFKIKVEFSNLLYQKFDIYLTSDNLVSEENLLVPGFETSRSRVFSIKEVNPMVSNLSSSYIAIFLRSSYNYQMHYRTYKSIIELIAQVGGIWKILFFLGAMIMVKMNSKLLIISIANAIFNLISPDEEIKKSLDNENYRYYEKEFSSKEPEKRLKLNNKTKLETEIALDYFKYERNKNITYSVQEALTSIFSCSSEQNSKGLILDYANKKVLEKLNTNKIFKFCVEIEIIKKLILGTYSPLLNYSPSTAIYNDKIPFIEETINKHLELEELDVLMGSFYKEHDLINGLRALQTKPLIDRIDMNLLAELKLKESNIRDYFLNHYIEIKTYLDKFTKLIPIPPLESKNPDCIKVKKQTDEEKEFYDRRKYLPLEELFSKTKTD
jgi:hypothetical protein